MRELSRMDPDEIEVLLKEYDFAKIHDRSVAIMAAADVEHALELALVNQFVPLSNGRFKELFERDGPLTSFSAKIKIASAMGLFGDGIRAELNRIRDIRNAFAHARRPILFSTRRIADECQKLRFFEMFDTHESIRNMKADAWPPTDPRQRYLEITGWLVLIVRTSSVLDKAHG